MRTITRVLWALITGVLLSACVGLQQPVQKPYAIALFAYVDGKVAAAQLEPAGSSLGECVETGKAAQKAAAAQGVSLGFQCFEVPTGAHVEARAPREPLPGSDKTTTL